MSYVSFNESRTSFTIKLPIPAESHRKYAAYQASVRAIKQHISSFDENNYEFPRLRIAAEYKSAYAREYFTWDVSLFSWLRPMDDAILLDRDAICSYRGNDEIFTNEGTELLKEYAQKYGKVVFVLDTKDTLKILDGESVTIHQEIPVLTPQNKE
jgi:hypothetical protein